MKQGWKVQKMFISATIEIELKLGETMDDGQRVD